MSQKLAPYRHSDGSNCWTKNCRLGNTTTKKQELFNQMKAQQDTVTPKISLIAPQEDFIKAVEDKRITGQKHPKYPYVIYKYSQQTTYLKDWDTITLASRGLVVNEETGEIVARPFGKFFNYSENQTPEHLMTGPFRVADKLDGSLGLLFKNPNGEYEITTAGGFQSDQAAHATEIYQKRYAGTWNPDDKYTYHFEIIYPQNRIVVNYGEEDDIYLLGAVNKKTGKSVPLNHITEWKGKRAQEYDNFNSIADVVNAPDPGISREGYIVHFTNTDTRVKFKFGEYLQVHKLATGLNARRIHEVLKSGSGQLEDFKMNAPEEFRDYIEAEEKKLVTQFNQKRDGISGAYKSLIAGLPKNIDQKGFALAAQKTVPKEYLSHMFTLHRGLPLNEEKIWDTIEPPYEKGFWATGSGS